MAEKTESSQDLRTKGNEAYLAGRLSEAISLYQESADLSPEDPAPLSNLSAAFFESGNYNASLAASDQSLALLTDEGKREKMYARKTKSLIHLHQYEAAANSVNLLADSPEKAQLHATIQNARSQLGQGTQDATGMQDRLITEVPRYKQQIRNVQQYMVVGHDDPVSLYDQSLLHTERNKISLLLAGVGDARHLHMTFLTAGFDKAAREKCFHFTIVDHKPAVIARDILILLMIDEFSEMLGDDEKKAGSLIFPLFYYTYISPIMPELLHRVLQVKIDEALTLMERPELIPAFLDVPVAFRAEVVRVLKEWQGEAGLEYPTKPVRKETIRLREEGNQHKLSMLNSYGKTLDDTPPPASCEKEKAFYEKFGILTMNWASHQLFYEEELQQAFADFDTGDPDALNTDFLDVIDENWKTNPTFVDLEWQHNREDSHMYLVVNHDPFQYGLDLVEAGAQAPEKQGLLNLVSFWLNGVAHGFSRMKGRFKVEACVGDITTILEQIKCGTVGHRAASSESSATTDETPSTPNDHLQRELAIYPTAYDRIHLSNIPDYIGGSLTTYLYAIPVLHPGRSSYVTATCLRNPSRWKSHQHFDNEYIGLSKPDELKQLFHVRMQPTEDKGDSPLLATYVKWHNHPVSPSFSNLLPRQHVENWLYRLFLKLAIPIGRQLRDFTLIYSPLNFTIFLRLCGHLHRIGYPAHWISGVLDDIVSGGITTTARPPRTDPLEIEEVEARRPMLKQSTKPFVAELTTLLSLWQLSLPFGVLSKHVPDLSKVHKYEFDFPNCEDIYAENPVFVLVLFHLHRLPGKNLRPILLSDEVADSSPRAREARETGLHIITTWEWRRATKTAMFWLREDVFAELKSDDWGLSIWRTDAWMLHSGPRGLKGLRDMGKF